MRNIKKILVEQRTGKTFYVKDLGDDFHTSYGIVASKDLKSKKTVVQSSKGKMFLVLDPNFYDLWNNLQRGPQIIHKKDIGAIIAKTGINKDSIAVDAGGGSGSLCLSLANVCKKVTTYEVNAEHHSIITKNMNLFGIKNLDIKQDNVYDGISEKNVDLITLDLPEPWRVIEHAQNSLKVGGFVVVYLPNLQQVKMFIDSCSQSNIRILETIELLERKWKIEGKIMRPEFQMLGHTGFLTFCRKL